jgi:methionyl-tRNA synthetase
MNVSFDIYSRTSNKIHNQTASDFSKKLYDDGLFEEKETEQYYDEKAKNFLGRQVHHVGTCPICGKSKWHMVTNVRNVDPV